MEKIVICVKVIKKLNEDNSVSYSLNMHDFGAIKMALSLKRFYKIPVVVLTLCSSEHEKMLKELILYGVDEVIILSDKRFVGSDTLSTSYILSKAISIIEDPAIIFCGIKSYDSATGQVPIELSIKLGFPFLPNVSEVKEINLEKKRIRVIGEYNKFDVGLFSTRLPCVITVDDKSFMDEIIIKTISGILSFSSCNIKVWSGEDIGVDYRCCGINGSPTKVIKTEMMKETKPQNKKVLFDIHDSINLVDDLLKQKK